MKEILYKLMFFSFALQLFCGKESTPKQPTNENADAGIAVDLKISKKNLASQSDESIQVKGYPIQVLVDMKNLASARQVGYYVHLLHKESGSGIKYFYQSSTEFFANQRIALPVSLGRAGSIDINKSFQIFAVVNTDKPYGKNPNGVREFDDLPGSAVKMIQVTRIR